MADSPLAPLYKALEPNPDAEYGYAPWMPWAKNRVGSASWVQEGANTRFAMPAMVREGLKGYLDLAQGMETGKLTPEAMQTVAFGGMGAGAAMAPRGALASGGAPIRAYHGSPHNFDRFDASKIGTGEGAQAYGHGLYFAEKEAVAKQYRDALSGPQANIMGEPIAFGIGAGDAVAKIPGLTPNAREMLRWNLIRGYAPEEAIKSLRNSPKDVASLEAAIAQGHVGTKTVPGSMYEVGIHADPQRFLDWDKPIRGQPRALDIARQVGVFPDETGGQLIRSAQTSQRFAGPEPLTSISMGRAERNVAGALNEAGIPGIRYLDGGSRSAGDGSRNYVVFPGQENIIEILRKYGLMAPAPVAVPGGNTGKPTAEQRQLMNPGLF